MGLSLALALGGCLSPETGHPDRVPVPPTSMFFEQSHHFCSDRLQDRFLVGYYGDALLDTAIYFYVVAHNGDTIYRDQWSAQAHLDGQNLNSSDSATIVFVQSQMRELVNGKQYESVRILPDSLPPGLDLGPPFHYRVGSTRDRTIAFSKAEKRVVEL